MIEGPRKRGRPRLSDDVARREHIDVRVTADERAAVAEVAADQGRTASELAREATLAVVARAMAAKKRAGEKK